MSEGSSRGKHLAGVVIESAVVAATGYVVTKGFDFISETATAKWRAWAEVNRKQRELEEVVAAMNANSTNGVRYVVRYT
jgi:hypothetical protein